MLTEEQLKTFKASLNARREQLRTEIREHLLQSDDERFARLAGEAPDLEDAALADLLVDVNLADVSRRINELRDIEDALQRIKEGTYGICVDTGEPIELERLKANLTAKRTLRAQEVFERTHAGNEHPSM